MTRILIVEDDRALARVLDDSLTAEGFACTIAGNGNAAIHAATSSVPDLVLLDVGLPGRDGLALCRLWRETAQIPIILLTARTQKKDKLAGLQAGADDYVTKPFDLEELVARIRAVLRRARPIVTRLCLGPVSIDFENLRAWNGTEVIDLSHREFAILRYLAERPNRIVQRDELLHGVWGYPDSPEHTRSVDHAVSRLRRKIEADPHHPEFIHTVYGGGYLLTQRKQS
ncbi:MAG TPA: response regulator transcription factor [Vicinamibacterales bacterium]|nr:response regulator transcription factor [Vicinamibacterales bacterium]